MSHIADLEAAGFFRFVPPEQLAAVREECRRALESENPNRVCDVEGVARFKHIDAESLSEQGMAFALFDLAPLLAHRNIEVRRLTTSDIYVSAAGGEWLIVDDENYAFDAEGGCEQIDEGVVRLGQERFTLMHQPGNSWMPSSRAFSALVRKLLARAGSEDLSFARLPGENDQCVFLGTDAMANVLRAAGVRPLETWPELDDDPDKHAFTLPAETPIGESDLRDFGRFHRDDEELGAVIELVAGDSYVVPYLDDEVIVLRPGGSSEIIEAKSEEAARALVRELHDKMENGGRVIAQAATRQRRIVREP